MFEINDVVLHNRTDVCRITGIRQMPFLDRGMSEYYVLRPEGNDSAAGTTLYVPVDADESRLSRLFTADELAEMLESGSAKVRWIESPLVRKKVFSEIMSGNQPTELIALAGILTEQRARRLSCGQKFSESDEKLLTALRHRLLPLFRQAAAETHPRLQAFAALLSEP